MGDVLNILLLQNTLRTATPVVLAALGCLMTQHVNITNIGIEGMMLTGAFFAVLGSYFGEDLREWRCGSCDNCTGSSSGSGGALREVTDAAEEGVVRRILEAVEDFDGRIGAGKLSQILSGSKSAELTGRGFHRNRHFGRLAPLKQTKIMAYLKSLELGGYLGRVERGDFPCLELTARGLEVLNGHTRARIDMPELKREKRERRSGSKPSAAVPPPEGGETLFEALRQLRKEIAAKRGVPAYVVLSNTALIGLAEQRPQTLAEAQEVPGIGPVKAQTVIPPFLDVIREWEDE